jgi:hypothetical protein
MFGGSASNVSPARTVRITPPSPTRPARVAPVVAPTVAAPDRETEGKTCTDCAATTTAPRNSLISRIDPSKIAGASAPETRTPAGTGNACMRKAILEAAKSVVRRRYRNRPYSAGWCAQGVRHILNASGMTNSGGMGDAVSWHLAGTLKSRGFKNIIGRGMTAENAPPGAVLVFRGPATDMRRSNGGLPSRRARRGRSAGNWVGHVAVKGEVADRYYTDGRTEEPAVAGRTLVGIYVPVTCVNCRGAAAKCEDGR